MPVVVPKRARSDKHLVFCHETRQKVLEGTRRYVAMFVVGDFDLPEARTFAGLVLDDALLPPKAQEYFRNPVCCRSSAWTVLDERDHPPTLRHAIDNFSRVEYTDAYTFQIPTHEIEGVLGTHSS